MKKTLLAVIILIAISVNSQTTTWIQQTSGTANSLKSVNFVDFQTAYSVGIMGTALRTTDAGSNWQNMNVSTTNDLNDVFFINPQVGWIVGLNTTVLKTTNSGDTWSTVSIPFSGTVNTVFFINENIGWIGTNSQDSILYTTDGGVNWNKSKILGEHVAEIFFIDEDTGWLIDELGIYNTNDGGVNWNQQFQIGQFYDGTSIFFIDANNGWATASDNKIWHTTNGGNNWEEQTSGLMSQDDINQVTFTNANNGIAVASNATEGFILTTTDGGANWLIDDQTSDVPLLDVDLIDENTVYVTGIQGRIYRKQIKQDICIVFVDTLTGKNKIVWEKIYNQATAKYIIYKLVGSNYVFLAEQAFNDLTEYIDYSSDPMVVAARYKITIVDSLNNESAQSSYPQTINLFISQGVPASTAVLQWNQYEDESGEFVPNWYYIYKGTTPSNMALHDSVSAAFISYNDINNTELHYYTIQVRKDDACTSEGTSKTSGGPYSHSLSNLDDYGIGTFVDNKFESDNIKIYPNPAKNNLHITIDNVKLNNTELVITDIAGKIVKQLRITNYELQIDIADLEKGTYFITIKAGKVYRGKFVKQ